MTKNQYMQYVEYAAYLYGNFRRIAGQRMSFRCRVPLQLPTIVDKSRKRSLQNRLESTKIVKQNIDPMPNDRDCTDYTASSPLLLVLNKQ